MHDTALQTFRLRTEIGFRRSKGLKIVRRAGPSMCLPSVYLMLHEIIACDDIFRSYSTVFGEKYIQTLHGDSEDWSIG